MRFLKSFNNLFRTHWLAILSIGGAFVGFCVYTFFFHYHFGRSDLVFENQFLYLPLVEKYFEGTLTFNDLWSPAVEHRQLGYYIIYVLNAAFFNMSGFLEYYINAVVMLVSTILTYIVFYQCLKGYCKDLNIQILFLPIVLLMLGLTNWSYIAFGGMLVSVMMGSIFYLISYILLNKLFFAWSGRNALFFFISSLFGTLIFGGSYFLIYFAAIFFTYIVKVLFERKLHLNILVLTVSAAVVGVAIYLWNYPIVGHAVGKLFSDGYSVLHMIQFMLLVVANSITQTSLYEAGFDNYNILYSIGIAVLILYLYALRVFKISGMYRKTYMPVFFLGYALGLFAMLMVLRSDQPLSSAFGTWWYVHTKFGLIAIMWIFYYASLKPIDNVEGRILSHRPTVSILFFILFIGTFYTNFSELSLLESRRAVLMNTRNAVLFERELIDANITKVRALEPITDLQTKYTDFYATADVTSKGLEIMEKYSLNVFSEDFKRSVFESDVGQDMENSLLAIGWHDPEWGSDGVMYRWVEADVRTLINSGQSGKLFIEGYAQNFFPEIGYTISADGKQVGSGVVTPGPFTISVQLPIDKNVLVDVVFDKSFTPETDVRELSVMIKKFYAL